MTPADAYLALAALAARDVLCYAAGLALLAAGSFVASHVRRAVRARRSPHLTRARLARRAGTA